MKNKHGENVEICVMCSHVIKTDHDDYEIGESVGEYWCRDCADGEKS